MSARPILLATESAYGQTTAIADRIATILEEEGFVVERTRVKHLAPHVAIETWAGVILGSRVQFGRHHRALERFAAAHRKALDALPNAFFSVSMSAAGGEPQQVEADRILANFEKRTGWHPKRSAKIAGKLAYTRYNFLLRWVMLGIARSEGHETDTSRDWEHTDWAQVEAFARAFAADVRAATKQPEAVPAK